MDKLPELARDWAVPWARRELPGSRCRRGRRVDPGMPVCDACVCCVHRGVARVVSVCVSTGATAPCDRATACERAGRSCATPTPRHAG